MSAIQLLSRGGVVRAETLVDPDDCVSLSQWTWRLSPNGYATRFDAALNRTVYMHRLIMGLALGDERQVDHISRDKLDNRRLNLRLVTRAQQSQNVPGRRGTSRYRGVCWDSTVGRWLASATLDGRFHFIGHFNDEEAAAAAASSWRAKHMPFSIEAAA